MRFLLDTNILIPLEDSQVPLVDSLANFVRMANEHGHQLLYHPASEDDINRDPNMGRRAQTLQRLRQYTRLDTRPPCSWNTPNIDTNDASDNEILYALHCDAVHALVTEDRGIHDKAKVRGLVGRVYTIQTAEDWLRRLHEKQSVPLPNVEEVELYSLTPCLGDTFFDSLRASYDDFDEWFRNKAREGRKAWLTRELAGGLGAICIFAHQHRETITVDGRMLRGPSLKLSTFKVGPAVRGHKIGELFLKAAFRYATANHLQEIFIHGDIEQHHFLFQLLEEFGFKQVGIHPGTDGRDAVYLKEHPVDAPPINLEPFEYLRQFFPHFRHDEGVGRFIVPIRPDYHQVLFPDCPTAEGRQLELFQGNQAGNAIKLAYLCHAQTKIMNPGDVVLFYRSGDQRAITSLGVVESYETLEDSDAIASKVKRRTVYSLDEISDMVNQPTRVMLFRLVKHFQHPLDLEWLKRNRITNGAPQSIMKISVANLEKVLAHGA
ncbi:MAG TPA: N-acetyltransferase [Nitrospiraceae bacterium]|nr:N-acetyltransferase [Nitrospiraceae bacterium]